MAMKDFNFKQFLFEKGERIGLYVCAGLGGLLLLLTVFSLFGEGSDSKRKKLDTPTQSTNRNLNTPREREDLPPQDQSDLPQGKVETALFQDKRIPAAEFDRFQVATLFSPSSKPDARRQKPDILRPEDSRVAVLFLQLRSYVLQKDYSEIMIIKGGDNTPGNVGGLYGGGSGRRGEGDRRPGRGEGPRGPSGDVPQEDPSKGKETVWVKATEDALNDVKGHPAEDVRPLRAVEIVFDFPYRLQLEEYQRKLRKKSLVEVIQEVNEKDNQDNSDPLNPTTNQGQNSFRFRGVEMERREVDARGEPILSERDKNSRNKDELGWVTVDLEAEYVDYVLLSGQRTEPEDDPRLEDISFPGLVMPRLLQFREKQYPKLETELTKIKTTLEEIKNAKASEISSPRNVFTTRKGFDPWRSKTNETGNNGGQPGPGPGPKPGPNRPSEGPRNPPRGGDRRGDVPQASDKDVIPEYCLGRVFDVTVETGKIYQYRLRVKMANPNYKMTENVASDRYADDEVLRSEWYEVPQKVSVPAEMHYYAVDQKELERGYGGINRQAPERGQTVLQIHRWLQFLQSQADSNTKWPVGEWVVAERVMARRGEYLGKPIKVDVPLWKVTNEMFVLAGEKPGASPGVTSRGGTGYPVSFGYKTNDTLLVDFEGGGEVMYERSGDKATSKIFREKAPAETLLYTHEGKLISLDGAVEGEDAERQKRVENWRARVKEVREKKKPAETTGVKPPFGG